MTLARLPASFNVCACAASAPVIRAGRIVCALCAREPVNGSSMSAPPPRPFTQVERPPGCGKTRFLRVWRLAHDAGDAGATADGRARLLTAEAYARFSPTLTTRRSRKVDAPAVSETLLEELGVEVASVPPVASSGAAAE